MIITVDNVEYSLHPINDHFSDQLPMVWLNECEEPVVTIHYRLYRCDAGFTRLGTLTVIYCTEKKNLKQAVEDAIREWFEESDEQEMFDDES